MKTPQKSVCCSRCGDELSTDEMLQLDEPVCALCDNNRAEALQIYKHTLRNGKSRAVRNARRYHIVGQSGS